MLPDLWDIVRRSPTLAKTAMAHSDTIPTDRGSRSRPRLVAVALGTIAGLALLYLLSRSNYLLFHSLIELFSIFVAFAIFVVAWNTRRWRSNDYLLFIGIAYLFVGLVDVFHTLAYVGMGVFPGLTANEPTQLWLVARYIEAFSLLAAPVFLTRRLRTTPTIAFYAVLVVAGTLSVLEFGAFPNAFGEGAGLTTFKVISEYLIIVVLAGAVWLLVRNRHHFARHVLRLLIAGIVATMAAELSFTLYNDVYGFGNMAGHMFKLASFAFVYRAVVVGGLATPHEVLYRDVSEGRAWFRAVYEQSAVGIELYDGDGRLLDVNSACRALFGVEDATGLQGFSLFDDPNLPEEQKQRLRAGEPVGYEHEFDFGLVREQGLYRTTRKGIASLHVEIVPLHIHGNTVDGYVVRVEDVTTQRAWADALERSHERFRTLFESAPDAFYITDLDGWFLDANSAAEEMIGRSRVELAGRSFADSGILAATEVPRAMSLLTRSRQGEETGPDELELLRSDGARLIVEVRTLPIELEERPVVLGIARDITQRRQVEEDLRESEEKFRAVFEESLDAIYIGRLDGSIVDVNEAWLEMFGYSREEIHALNAADLYAEPNDRDEFLRRIVQDGRVDDVVRYRRKDGTTFECQRILVAKRNKFGSVVGAQGVNRDVSARLQAERALQESEEKFRALFEQSLDAIFINSPDGQHIDVNQAWLDMFGYSRDDLETFHPVDLYSDPADRQDFLQRIQGSNYVDDEVWLKRKDGTPVLCHRMIVARRDENGRIVAFQGVMRDITEQRRAEEALRQSEEEYRRLFEQSRDAVYLIAADGRITNANGAATELFGYTRAELLSMNVQSLYADPSIRTEVIRDALERGGLQDYELSFKRKDGDVRECVVTTTVLRDSKGAFIGFQSVIRDVTEQKRAELHLREYAQRLDTAMSAGNLAWWQMDLPSGRVLFDERKATVLGRDPAEFRHYLDFCQLLHPDDYDSAMVAMRDHLEGRTRRYQVEYRIQKADGDYLWFRDVGSITSYHDDGSPAVVTGIVVDITALKTTEQRLEESNRELQRVAASIDIAREEERASVAWELHDEVAQALSAVKMDLHACSRNLPPDVLTRVEPTLKEVRGLLDDTIERLRRLYTDLVPVMLEDLGLAAALEWYLQSFQEETGIETRLNSPEGVSLPTDRHGLMMYRLVQEALDSIRRHPGATSVIVEMERLDDRVVLRVYDNSSGLGSERAAMPAGLGISSMRERMRSIGGEAHISVANDGGMVVEAFVPVSDAGTAGV